MPKAAVQRRLRGAPHLRLHHEDVGIGIRAGLAPAQRAKQDHLFGREPLHQPLVEAQQQLADEEKD
jgi:hypothetical protein